MCDELFVGVSTDEFCIQKGKRTILNYEQRKNVVESIRYVDFVFPEMSLIDDKILDGLNYDANMFVWGNDWEGTFDFLNDYGFEVKYLPRTPGISTTEIKNNIYNIKDIE